MMFATMLKPDVATLPLLDVPTTFSANEGPYTPLNFDRSFHGVVPLRIALASSFFGWCALPIQH